MSRSSTICKSPDRGAIDAALVNGTPYGHIAACYGMSTGAVQRHRNKDILALVQAAREEMAKEDLDRGADLLDQVQLLVKKARGILNSADDQRTALVAVRGLRRTLELLAKLTGQLRAPDVSRYDGPMFIFPPGTKLPSFNVWQNRQVEGAPKEIDFTPPEAKQHGK